MQQDSIVSIVQIHVIEWLGPYIAIIICVCLDMRMYMYITIVLVLDCFINL